MQPSPAGHGRVQVIVAGDWFGCAPQYSCSSSQRPSLVANGTAVQAGPSSRRRSAAGSRPADRCALRHAGLVRATGRRSARVRREHAVRALQRVAHRARARGDAVRDLAHAAGAAHDVGARLIGDARRADGVEPRVARARRRSGVVRARAVARARHARARVAGAAAGAARRARRRRARAAVRAGGGRRAELLDCCHPVRRGRRRRRRPQLPPAID